jgi:hypothetical protein
LAQHSTACLTLRSTTCYTFFVGGRHDAAQLIPVAKHLHAGPAAAALGSGGIAGPDPSQMLHTRMPACIRQV